MKYLAEVHEECLLMAADINLGMGEGCLFFSCWYRPWVFASGEKNDGIKYFLIFFHVVFFFQKNGKVFFCLFFSFLNIIYALQLVESPFRFWHFCQCLYSLSLYMSLKYFVRKSEKQNNQQQELLTKHYSKLWGILFNPEDNSARLSP